MLEIANNSLYHRGLSEQLKSHQQVENDLQRIFTGCCLLACKKYDGYSITGKGLRSLRIYSELRQMISSKQKEEIKRRILSTWLSLALSSHTLLLIVLDVGERHSP